MKKVMRVRVLGALLLCALGLTACATDGQQGSGSPSGKSKTKDEMVTSVSVNKDGSIESRIVEEFEASYYDVSALRTMIEEAAAEYTNETASAEVSLEGCEVVDGKVNVEIKYNDYNAYAGFNGETFFAGTIQEAYQAGFDLNVTLKAVSDKDDAQTVSKQELLGMGDNHIIIFERPLEEEEEPDGASMRINCYGDILYVGDNVSTVGKKSADVNVGQGVGVIVFK
ncbi:MAG: hypothetical protein NC337_15520 [Roseburia sp.]|nr:hypothetical protein [Roseburia sp.]